MNARIRTALAVAVIATVPIGIQWNANHQLRDRLVQLENQLTAARSAPAAGHLTASIGSTEAAGEGAPAAFSEGGSIRQWQQALFEPDPVRRSLWLSQLFSGLRAETAPAVAEIFDQAKASGVRLSREQELFMRVWGGLDGIAAVNYAVSRAGAPVGSPMVLAAVAGWGAADPRSAEAWVAASAHGQNKEDLIYGLIAGWATIDLEGASRYAEARPPTPAQDRMRQMLLEHALMIGGIPAAQQWFHGIPDEAQNQKYKQLLFDEIVQRMVPQDPAAAARWISDQQGRFYLGGDAIRNTASELARWSPTNALDWLLALANLTTSQAANSFSQVLGSWATQDALAAGNWLNAHAHHPEYDAMASRFVHAISDLDPVVAIQWAKSIDDEALRYRSLLLAGAGLLVQQGNEAIPQLKAAGLTDEMIANAPLQREGVLANLALEYFPSTN